MKTFKVPVTWEVYGIVQVEANTPEEALYNAKEIEHQGEGFELPLYPSYIDGSFRIEEDIELVKILNQYDKEI